MRETWYVLEDGAIVDPNEVQRGEQGRLVHASGVAVAMRGDVPHSRGVDDADEERRKATAARDAKAKEVAEAAAKDAASRKEADTAKDAASPNDREMKAEGGKKYKTR